MRFDRRRPCANCPFRSDVPGYLTRARVESLEEALEHDTFICHKTVDYEALDEAQEGEGEHDAPYPGGDRDQHCAGALILQEKLGRPSTMAQIAERLDLYDPTKLDLTAPVYNTWDEMKEAMPR